MSLYFVNEYHEHALEMATMDTIYFVWSNWIWSLSLFLSPSLSLLNKQH